MDIVLISLFIATILPILTKAPLAWAMNKEGGYDNRYPREQQAKLQGFGARAQAAHLNSFEALIMYTPGALAVVALNAATQMMQYYAMAFIVARIAYCIMYWLDQDKLRSVFWGVGLLCSLLMMWHAMQVAAQLG